MVLAVIVPIVSVYMLFDDPLQDNPSWKQIFIAFLTSILFVWIGYEASVETGIPVWIGLILSFAVGLSAMPIIRKVRTKLPKAVESIIDYIPEWVKNKIK